MIRKSAASILALAILVFAISIFARPAAAAQQKIRVAIVTGGHGFDTKALPKLYEGVDDMAVDLRADKDPNAIFNDIADFKYDVVILYNFSNKPTDIQKQNMVKLLDKGIGLVVWHHAAAAYPDWPEFEALAGVKFWLQPGEKNGEKIAASGARDNVKMKIHVEDADNPITKGVTDFELTDEPYVHQTFTKDITVILSCQNEFSDKAVAWTRMQGKSRVVGLQLGHDDKAWSNPSFHKIWLQAIRWTAGR